MELKIKTKEYIRRLAAMLLMALLIAGTVSAQEYPTPESLPNPMQGGRRGYVCNPDGLLTAQQQSTLNAQLEQMQQQSSVEMAVVVVNSIGDADPVTYTVDVGTLWGVGKSSNSNGVILLIAMQSHDIALQTGYGMEGVITDMAADDIIDDAMVPRMRSGDLFGAIEACVAEVGAMVSTPEARKELLGTRDMKNSGFAARSEEASNALSLLIILVVVGAFIFGACYWAYTARLSRKRGKDWYGRAEIWRKSLTLLLVAAICSAGAGLIFYLSGLYKYRRWRTRRRICRRCGKKMKRMNEQEDNAYLTPGQDMEEKLGTVDYDVWVCPDCGEVEIYPFASADSKYEKCPRCGTKAYATQYKRILHPARRGQRGRGEIVKVCKHCGYTHSTPFYFDDDNSDGTGAAIAGIALGTLMGMGRGGGGGFGGGGGGFGGGGFGGGGASGKW